MVPVPDGGEDAGDPGERLGDEGIEPAARSCRHQDLALAMRPQPGGDGDSLAGEMEHGRDRPGTPAHPGGERTVLGAHQLEVGLATHQALGQLSQPDLVEHGDLALQRPELDQSDGIGVAPLGDDAEDPVAQLPQAAAAEGEESRLGDHRVRAGGRRTPRRGRSPGTPAGRIAPLVSR